MAKYFVDSAHLTEHASTELAWRLVKDGVSSVECLRERCKDPSLPPLEYLKQMCDDVKLTIFNAKAIQSALVCIVESSVITPTIIGVKRKPSVDEETVAEKIAVAIPTENPPPIITKYSRPKRQRVANRRNAGRNVNVAEDDIPAIKIEKVNVVSNRVHPSSSSSSSTRLSASFHHSDDSMQIDGSSESSSSSLVVGAGANNTCTTNSDSFIDKLTILYLEAIRHEAVSLDALKAFSETSIFALGLLMSLHAAGFGVPENVITAKEIANRIPNFRRYFEDQIKTSAIDSSINKCSEFIVGICRFYKVTSVDEDKSQKPAINYFQRSANQGYCPALYYLGRCYHYGLHSSTKKDPVIAIDYYERAVSDPFRHPVAFCALGFIYEEGADGVIANPVKAMEMYRKAGSYPEALVRLGFCYRHVSQFKNDALGTDYYKQAADLKHPPAMYNLGCCYLQGTGVVQIQAQRLDSFNKLSIFVQMQILL